jgi:chromosome partitioning protein
MRTIAIANQKGGCGKTTTTVNLAAAFAEKGNKTLLIDLDPQGHSTIGFGYDPDEMSMTIYDALVNDQIGISEVTVGTKFEQLELAPGNVLLSGAELDLKSAVVLREKLTTVKDRYEVCIIDCPPSLGLLTLNGLLASTSVIVPVQVHYYAMEGLRQLFKTMNAVRGNFDPCYVRDLGLLLTFVENRTLLSKEVQQQMREYFGDLVYTTVIHKNVKLAEAPSAGEPILTYASESRAADEYRALAKEIIDGRAVFEQIKSLAEEITAKTTSAEPIISHEVSVRR